MLVTAPDELRASFTHSTTTEIVRRSARLRPGRIANPTAATKVALATLARRWLALTTEIDTLDEHLTELTATCAPSLVALNGVGPQTAAALLTAAGDNPDRLASERSFAALCGTSPRDASSGRQQRHRLNRGGDRAANSALYIIAISRLRWDPATKAYMARRLSEEQDPQRGHPLHQALHRQRSPHRHHQRPRHLQPATRATRASCLTSIEASGPRHPHGAGRSALCRPITRPTTFAYAGRRVDWGR